MSYFEIYHYVGHFTFTFKLYEHKIGYAINTNYLYVARSKEGDITSFEYDVYILYFITV